MPAARPYVVPLVTILCLQSVMTMAAYSIPVVIPAASVDLGINAESVGYLVSLIYGTGMVVGLATGALIARFGATQLFQLMALCAAAGTGVLWISDPWSMVLAAILFGVATGPMNPAGSHVLARVTDVKNRALVFSLKQCGTPAGGMLAGTLLPPLMLIVGWQWALMLIPALLAVCILLAPFGRLGGRELVNQAHSAIVADTLSALKSVILEPSIRSLTVAGFCLATAQMGVTTYLVVFLWREIGFTEAAAGLVFAILHFSGISARIVLGMIADRIFAATWVLIGICLVLACSLALMSQFTAAWPVPIVYLVTMVIGATGNGWVGLYFAELARLAPPSKVAEIAGGSQFFTYVGLVTGPLLFGGLLKFSGSYTLCFMVFAFGALLSGIYLAYANSFGRVASTDRRRSKSAP